MQEYIPDSVVVLNKVPKEWVDFEIYCQLVPNDDPNDLYYAMVPRTGSFEVSFHGVVSILISVTETSNIVDILKAIIWHVASL